MWTIVKKTELSPGVKLFWVKAPLIARKCKPGQFIILRINEDGERIPLTIADTDLDAGTIALVFQEVGCSTRHLGRLEEGDVLLDLAGPLGKPSHIDNFGTVVCVGGGIGVAPLYPITRAYKNAGNKVISIIGARTADLLIMEKEMAAYSDEIYVTTDDGSYGIKGRVTDPLMEVLAREKNIGEIMAIGPVIMMKSVAEATRPSGIHTVVSLNPIMVDGTGMCGCCRVSVGEENKFACVDGPEFDGHKVDFDGLMIRQRMYREEEAQEAGGGECKCQNDR